MKRICLSTLLMILVSVGHAATMGDALCDSLLQAGDSCMTMHDIRRAALSYEKALALSPQNTDAMKRLARCHYMRGAYHQAISLLESISPEDTLHGTLSHDELRTLYYSYQKTGAKEKMYACGRNIMSRFAYDGDVLSDLAKNMNAGGRADEALGLTRRFLAVDSTHLLVLKQYGDACYLTYDMPEARRVMRRLRKLGDTSFDVVYTIGQCFYQEERFDSAATYLHQALNLNEQHAGCLYRLGISEIRLQQPGDGIVHLYQATGQLEPDTRLLCHICEYIAEGYRQQSNLDMRIAMLNRCIDYEPLMSKYPYMLAECWREKGDMPKAIEAYEKFLMCSRIVQADTRTEAQEQQIRSVKVLLETLKETLTE